MRTINTLSCYVSLRTGACVLSGSPSSTSGEDTNNLSDDTLTLPDLEKGKKQENYTYRDIVRYFPVLPASVAVDTWTTTRVVVAPDGVLVAAADEFCRLGVC